MPSHEHDTPRLTLTDYAAGRVTLRPGADLRRASARRRRWSRQTRFPLTFAFVAWRLRWFWRDRSRAWAAHHGPRPAVAVLVVRGGRIERATASRCRCCGHLKGVAR